jgi:heat-inducible transcriptional repressor
MNERQEGLLKTIVTEYVKTAEPVSSKLIADAGNFGLSSATIRNEMADLEEQGYICHPHTSAGRVPTEKGYQYFIKNFIDQGKVAKKHQAALDKLSRNFQSFEPSAVKSLAKEIAELSHNAVFIAFSDNDFYYTGLSNLFSQPEFSQQQLVYELSLVIEHLDQVIKKLFSRDGVEVEIVLGSQNPFAADCGSIIAHYQSENNQGILGIIGPMRMDYQNGVSLVKYSQKLINKLK